METNKSIRGGARIGAGAKAKEGIKKQWSCILPIELLEEFENLFPERGALVTDIKNMMRDKIEKNK